MENENKDLYYLNELSDYRVADHYPDVRGWEVMDMHNVPIGKVDNFLVSKSAERVVYLDVEVNESIIGADHEAYGTKFKGGIHEFMNKDGDNHLIIPIGTVNLDEKKKCVLSSSIAHEAFSRTARFSKGTAIDRNYEKRAFSTYLSNTELHLINDDAEFYNRKEFKKL